MIFRATLKRITALHMIALAMAIVFCKIRRARQIIMGIMSMRIWIRRIWIGLIIMEKISLIMRIKKMSSIWKQGQVDSGSHRRLVASTTAQVLRTYWILISTQTTWQFRWYVCKYHSDQWLTPLKTSRTRAWQSIMQLVIDVAVPATTNTIAHR